MTPRPGSNWHVLAVAALIAILPLAIYGGAYCGLSTGTSRNLTTGGACRVFRSQWQAMLFLPACLVESALTGRETSPAWPQPGP